MRGLAAFTKKEFLELFRTGRFVVCAVCFACFGIMNPAMAKLTPWMMEMMADQLADSGMMVVGVEVDAMTSWAQFFKNMPMALLILVVLSGSSFTGEYQKGTLFNMVTKGLERWKIVIAKTAVLSLTWTGGYLVSFWITYGYNEYFWDNGKVSHVFFAAFCLYMLGLWLLTVIPAASALFQGTPAVLLSVGAVFAGVYVLGLFPAFREYLPTYLLESPALLAGMSGLEEYGAALAVGGVLAVGNVLAAGALFQKKSL